MQNRCLVVFVKYPQPGQVKSRLAKDFDSEFAAGLYKTFALDILECAAKGDWQLRIFFDPPEKETEIKNLLTDNYQYRPQRGVDLGARMKNAFADCFSEGFRSVVLIGSDFPDLPQKIIEDAFALLDSPSDAVIGPAADGGYYLIGLKAGTFLPDIFSGLSWSTASVFSKTLKILQACGQRTEILQEWHDVDTRNDLINLMERNKSTAFAHSRTMKYLLADRNFSSRKSFGK
jgi:rSAM/selenodomain-associated transferase 1